MKKFLIVVIALALVVAPMALKQAAAAPGRQTTPESGTDTLGPLTPEAPAANDYIVRLAPGVSAEQAGLSKLGEVFPYPELPGTGINFAVVKPGNEDQRSLLSLMADSGDLSALSVNILSVEENGYAVLQVSWETDDPMYQWGNGAGCLGCSFPKSWTTKTTAILDTGQARNHEDLPIVPTNDRVTVQNGRIIYGSCTDLPGEGHGTHVVGIATMLHNNRKGGAGVLAATGRILCIKSFHGFSASFADIAWGLLYAGVERAKFLNASWGSTGENELVTRAIEFYLSQGDSYIIAACGNYGSWFPGCIFPASLAGKPGFERVISVGALNAGLNPASFSQWGIIWAPGEQICSTFPDNTYKCWSGTSMAAPYALGVIAAMLERRPLAEGETLMQRLQACSLRLPWGGLFPRWECIGGKEEVFVPLILKQP